MGRNCCRATGGLERRSIHAYSVANGQHTKKYPHICNHSYNHIHKNKDSYKSQPAKLALTILPAPEDRHPWLQIQHPPRAGNRHPTSHRTDCPLILIKKSNIPPSCCVQLQCFHCAAAMSPQTRCQICHCIYRPGKVD